MAQSTLSSIPPQVIESGQVSVDDITGTQFLILRELGWEIAGALVFDPAKNGATRRSKGAASKTETPPQVPKPPPRTLRAPKKALKASPTKPHSTHKKSKKSNGGQRRQGFVTFPDKDKVNWNDTSEDGEQWRR